jgi:hypothetical protein
MPHVKDAPGLVWRRRTRSGKWIAYWQARSDLVKRGYEPGAVVLWRGVEPTEEEAQHISHYCHRQQLIMRTWGNERDSFLLANKRQCKSPEDDTTEAKLARLGDRIRRRITKADRIKRDVGVVYFVRSPAGIKIGFSVNMKHRLNTLQNASAHELELLGTIPGTFRTESTIHKMFSNLRMRGEWFQNHPSILEYIKEVAV